MRILSLFIAIALLFGLVADVSAARDQRPALNDTLEWVALSKVWREMSEHWRLGNRTREQFVTLGLEMDSLQPGIISLEARDYFDEKTRLTLEDLCAQRYLFIRSQRYSLRPAVTLVDLDSQAFQARINVEDNLARLLWPPEVAGLSKEEIRRLARRRIAVELEFLRRATALKRTIALHRAEAQKKEADGEIVDWVQFNYQASNLTRELINAYMAGKIEPDEETQALTRLVLSLTEDPLSPELLALIEAAPAPESPAKNPEETAGPAAPKSP